MSELAKTLQIRHAPHLSAGLSVDHIMRHVVLALAPVCGFAIYVFGLAAAVTIAAAVASCVLTEAILSWCGSRESTIGDWSAAVTGVLYGLTLPPTLPVWMVVVGGVLAIALGKWLFGGLGCNPFNPALVGRAMLQAAFPVAMTTWPPMPSGRFTTLPGSILTPPLLEPTYDAVTGATPLAEWKFAGVDTETADLLVGTVSGSTGETSAILIALGGLYLISRRMMRWQIPLSILLTVSLLSLALHSMNSDRFAGPAFMLCSGGLMLGAVFMATDPVGSPMTPAGCIVFGVLIGVLVVLIRVWGGMPEGVMYAILLSNAVTPHIDNWIQPRAYGTGRLPHV